MANDELNVLWDRFPEEIREDAAAFIQTMITNLSAETDDGEHIFDIQTVTAVAITAYLRGFRAGLRRLA